MARRIAVEANRPSLGGVGGGLETDVERIRSGRLPLPICRRRAGAYAQSTRARNGEMDADDVESLAALPLDLDEVAVDGKDPDSGEEREKVCGSSVAAVPDAESRKYRGRAEKGDPDGEPRFIDVHERSDDEQRDRGERHDP